MMLKTLYDFAKSRDLFKDAAFSEEPVHWIISLSRTGKPGDLVPLYRKKSVTRGGETTTKDVQGLPMSVPARYHVRVDEQGVIVNVGNAGGEANFLADNVRGLFGIEVDGTPPRESTEAQHKDFIGILKRAKQDGVKSSTLDAILAFYENQDVRDYAAQKSFKGGDRLTFRVGDDFHALEDPALRDWWRQQVKLLRQQVMKMSVRGQCLVLGTEGHLLNLHPSIYGVPGGNPTGTKVVSFDKDSFASFGLETSLNGPTSVEAAEGYALALNRMLSEAKYRLRFGDAAVCFWARDPSCDVDWGPILSEADPDAVKKFLFSPFKGVQREAPDEELFYSMILSGNGGRVVVREWITSTLPKVAEALKAWFENTTLGQQGEKRYFGIHWLAKAVVPGTDDPPARLIIQLYLAAVKGVFLAVDVLAKALDRQGAEMAKGRDGVNYFEPRLSARTALIRYWLNTHTRGEKMKDSLDENNSEPAYLCGRLLALLDSIHKAAHQGKTNVTPADRFYGSASATPVLVFPILCKTVRYHLAKIDAPGLKYYYEEALAKLVARLAEAAGGSFPRHLGLEEQGRFAIGFYQERAQHMGGKRKKEEDSDKKEEAIV